MASCVVVTAYISLLFGFLAIGVSFFAPFWIHNINDNAYEGLWGRCRTLNINVGSDLGDLGSDLTDIANDLKKFECVWFHQDDFGWERTRPVWFLACQVLDAFGIVTVFAILFVATIHLCCSCCKESISLLKAIGVVLIFGACMLVSCMGAFAGMSYHEYKTSMNSQVSKFEWGYYVDIPGVILVILSALLYLIESCRYDGYESGHNEIV